MEHSSDVVASELVESMSATRWLWMTGRSQSITNLADRDEQILKNDFATFATLAVICNEKSWMRSEIRSGQGWVEDRDAAGPHFATELALRVHDAHCCVSGREALGKLHSETRSSWFAAWATSTVYLRSARKPQA